MRLTAIAFLIGVLIFQQLENLPTWTWTLIFIPLAVANYYVPRLWVLIVMALGVFWVQCIAYWQLSDPLPESLEGKDLIIRGVVSSIPHADFRRTRFQFDVLELMDSTQPSNPPSFPQRLLLNWYNNAPELLAGDLWQLQVRLKRPHGFMNPGGFDYEGWLFRQGIAATGYVRHKTRSKQESVNRKLQRRVAGYGIIRMRQSLLVAIQSALGGQDFAGIITALSIGYRQQLTQDHWRTLSRTGTNHLMAISGLHVGLVSGLMFFLFRWLWSLSAIAATWLPAPKAGALAGLLAALIYALLAGFAVPTQRALVMIAVVMVAIILQRAIKASQVLAAAMLFVLVWDPLSVLDTGFWLSFLAVAMLLIGMSGRLSTTGLWWKWGRAQWVVFVGLGPILWFYFNQFSLVSPIANVIAIPWVSLVTVPLSLLGALVVTFVPSIGVPLLQLAHDSVALLWPLLDGLSASDYTQWVHTVAPLWAVVVALLGALLLLLPAGLPGRWLGVIFLLPLVFVRPNTVPPGMVRFTLLDVGQGLAAILQTTGHSLVFDTGPRFSVKFNTGDAIVLPFLRENGISTVDLLLVSHGDNDHMGGARAVFDRIPVRSVLTSDLDKLGIPDAVRCRAGQNWTWDGVDFALIHPANGHFPGDGNDNNQSCVLRVTTANGSILLSADIEKPAEDYLVDKTLRGELNVRADILVVPHHGSKTSSSARFIDAVAPKVALFPIGYRNRYGFPKPAVVDRFDQRNIEMLDTAVSGAITYTVGGPSGIELLQAYRHWAKRYWHAPKHADYLSTQTGSNVND